MWGEFFAFWSREHCFYSVELPLFLAYGVHDLGLETFGLLFFFAGSNLDIQLFLSKEGKNLASSREW